MCVDDTEKTITVDANVFSLYFQWKEESNLSAHEKIMLKDFCPCIMELYPIAMNDFIKSEYRALVNSKRFGLWYKVRLQKRPPLVKEVEKKLLSSSVKNALRSNYSFHCRSYNHGKDAKYIETCLNTIRKLLVTEDFHFYRPHNSGRKRRSMDSFLKQQLGISIVKIDGCSDELLGNLGK